VVDAKFAGIDDPAALARAIDSIPGVVEHGLFVGLADEALVGSAGGSVRTLRGVRTAR
jgi:ribose 5-phosphate isomerase A